MWQWYCGFIGECPYLGDACQTVLMSNVMMSAPDLQIIQSKKKKTLGIFYSHVYFTLLPPSPLAQCLGPRYSRGSTKMFLNILLKLKDKKWISRSNILTYSIHNSPLCQHSHKIDFKICVYWGRGTEKCLWPRKAIKWFSMPPLEFKLQAVPDQWFLGYYGRSTQCQVWP